MKWKNSKRSQPACEKGKFSKVVLIASAQGNIKLGKYEKESSSWWSDDECFQYSNVMWWMEIYPVPSI